MSISYLYELRQGEAVVATGRLNRDTPLEVGDRVGIVHSIEPTLDPLEQRLLIQLFGGR